MELESIIFTLFMVAILLTVSISDNITGRAADVSSGNCQCVKIPICDAQDVCEYVKLDEKSKTGYEDLGTGLEKHIAPKEVKCPDKCGGVGGTFNLPSGTPTYYIYHSKEVNGKCVIDHTKTENKTENCMAPPHLAPGKYKECKLVNNVGKCVETARAKAGAAAYAKENEDTTQSGTLGGGLTV